MLEGFIQRTLLVAPPILLALTVHECAHAWVAYRMGDPTAKMLGRITLNPIKHLDPIGTVALFLSGMFGWAKPVPINPRNFRDYSKGILWVSLAGPLSNITLAVVSSIIFKLFIVAAPAMLSSMPGVFRPLFMMVKYSIIINISLAIFNMIPIPPLDGSKVLSALLPPDKALTFSRIEPYGFFILLILIMSGATQTFISPLVYFTAELLAGGRL
jgi:Zn-dependent protease